MWTSRYLLIPFAVLTSVTSININEDLERDEIIEAVNKANTSWKASRNFHISKKKDYLKHLLGLKRHPGGSHLPLLEDDEDDSITLPANFDAREQWNLCVSIKTIRDQGPCGSCWAVAAASAFTDRLCIASNASFNSFLSAQNVLSCCSSCGFGCNGGYDDKAWQYFENTGIPTGGEYNSKVGCQPYTLPTCEHHVSGKRKNCSSYGDVPTPQCQKNCYNKNYKTPYNKDFHKVKTPFSLKRNIHKVEKEIFKHGSLEAGFDVYEDFLSYKSGVYCHTTGDYLGGHAVRVIGWGKEGNVGYWLVANSWNTDWGDNGYFKIKRGNNECGFEDEMSGGYPVV